MLVKYQCNHFSVPLSSQYISGNTFFNSSLRHVLLSYNDVLVKKVFEDLFYTIAENCEWCYPDVEGSEIDFLIDCSNENFKFDLIITAVPPKYSKADIDGLCITEEIALEANSFWENENYLCSNTLVVPVELTYKEENMILRSAFSGFMTKKVG